MTSPTLAVRFFLSSQGNEPVRDWLRSLSEVDRKPLLHGFIKKSQKTPADELRTAQARLKQLRGAMRR